MRLLTLNTHSLIEGNEENSLKHLSEAIFEYKFDVIALQEVNQPLKSDISGKSVPICAHYPIKNGNYMQKLIKITNSSSQNYSGVWCGFKESYNYFEEGIGIMSRYPIKDVRKIMLTSGQERDRWKRRYALGIKTCKGEFYSLHFGWWEDVDEPFYEQWSRLMQSGIGERAWLMGDFNGDAMDKSYSLVTKSGFYDTFNLAKKRDSGYTVTKKIDGWESRENKRIDYIFCNCKEDITESKTIFNGRHYDVVSDHFGVMIETEE